MFFGQNLQFLRKMGNNMTQEELAEKIGVSRQTISKWELNIVYPDMDKLVELCKLFSCTIDELVREDMNIPGDIYSDICFKDVEAFNYASYAVISKEPEEDAIRHTRQWAEDFKIEEPVIIGWDFPVVSQEQSNVYNMHGYAAALILNNGLPENNTGINITRQERQKYITITVKESDTSPFSSIPNAYKILMAHMKINGIKPNNDKNVLSCFEREYFIEGKWHMDIYIAVL